MKAQEDLCADRVVLERLLAVLQSPNILYLVPDVVEAAVLAVDKSGEQEPRQLQGSVEVLRVARYLICVEQRLRRVRLVAHEPEYLRPAAVVEAVHPALRIATFVPEELERR